MVRHSTLVLLIGCGAKGVTANPPPLAAGPVVCERAAAVWYLDADGDGYGADHATIGCRPSPAWVAVSGDCNDDYAAVHPATWWYPDADGDGWGHAAGAMQGCHNPGAHVLDSGDCDDREALVHPGAEARCGTVLAAACGSGPSVQHRGDRGQGAEGLGEGAHAGEAIVALLR